MPVNLTSRVANLAADIAKAAAQTNTLVLAIKDYLDGFKPDGSKPSQQQSDTLVGATKDFVISLGETINAGIQLRNTAT